MLLFIFAGTLFATSTITHTLPRVGSNVLKFTAIKPQRSRIVRFPYLNNPRQIIEQMVNRMGRSMRSLPSVTAKMFGNKVTTMARTGRQINKGVIKTGRSVTYMLKDLFN